MSKIWIFGDSFGELCSWAPEGSEQTHWHQILGRKLNMPVEIRAVVGTSLDWLYYEWREQRSLIEPGSIVISTITSTDRRWLIEEDPVCSRPWNLFRGSFDGLLPNKKLKAMRMYFQYLLHDKYLPSQLENWMYNLQALAEERDCFILLLPCFNSSMKQLNLIRKFTKVHVAKGHLDMASIKEFTEDIREATVTQEGRFNHLSIPNHQVLCDKILSWINNGVPVDLTQGFYENIIDQLISGPSDILPAVHKMSF